MACISEEDKQLLSRLDDLLHLSDKRCAPCFLGFLDAREQALLRCRLGAVASDTTWNFDGGYPNAERTMLAVYPDFYSADAIEYPFTAVAFYYRKEKQLSHRDFLGSLLASGIRRDKIGDILCGTGLSVVFLADEIASYVCEQITCIGREGVTLQKDYVGDLPVRCSYQTIQDTVASPRLDAVLKVLIRTSREEAAQLIRTGYVSVNHLVEETVSVALEAPCTISVRGHGRFLIDQFGPQTRKGRLQLIARKCI